MRPEAPLPTHPWRLAEQLSPAAPALPGGPPLVLALDRREPLPEALRQALAASLAPAERQRLEALRQLADRERFLRGRAALRLLLGAWLALPPAAVPIEAGPHGKPHCPGGPPFNVSHSGDLILLALHTSRPVGVDVEQARQDLDWRPVARRVLPPAEAEALERLAAGGEGRAAAEGFLVAWCRLEAGLKARGLGLAGLGDPPQGLTIWDVAVPAGYRAAVAVMAHPAAGAGACPPDPPG
ncbi:4'-phosphopantetheinyl transferase superfamily protein [Cyanobium sp. FGCU-52]|nr:4'-phosphopantetheinyl transferase superfamily protein [Cyanobium sp. FGCU52]